MPCSASLLIFLVVSSIVLDWLVILSLISLRLSGPPALIISLIVSANFPLSSPMLLPDMFIARAKSSADASSFFVCSAYFALILAPVVSVNV